MPSTIRSRDRLVTILFTLVLFIAVISTGSVAVSQDHSTQRNPDMESESKVTTNLAAMVGPGYMWPALESQEDVERAISSGNLTGYPTASNDPVGVTIRDTLVLEITSQRLKDHLSNQTGDNATARMQDLLDSKNASLSIVEQNPATMRHRMLLKALSPSASRVISGSNNTTYLVIDLAEAKIQYDGPDENQERLVDSPYQGSIFEVNFTLRSSQMSMSIETQEPDIEFTTPPGTHDVLVPAGENTTIPGRATVAPESTLRVEVYNEATGEMISNSTVKVNEHRLVTPTVNTTGMTNETLRIHASRDSRNLSTTTATVLEEQSTIEFNDQQDAGNQVEIEHVSLSHGGILVVRNQSGDGQIVAQTDLSNTGYHDITLQFNSPLTENATLEASVYHDSNGNETYGAKIDEEYGHSVVANYTVAQNEDHGSTTTQTESRDGSSPTETDSSEEDGNGLGIRIALLALLVAIALIQRQPRA